MAVSGRHIRWDWQTFVEWDQKSVSTVCGKKSTFNYTGIPGVTDQDVIVLVGNKRAFGWCVRCSLTANRVAYGALNTVNIHSYIKPMYEAVVEATQLAVQKTIEEEKRQRIRTLKSLGLTVSQVQDVLDGKATARDFITFRVGS